MNGFCFMARHPEAEGGFVKLRQERLDELLNRAFAKGARRGAKAPAGESGPDGGGAPGGDTGDSVISPAGTAAVDGGQCFGQEADVADGAGSADALGEGQAPDESAGAESADVAPGGLAADEALAQLAQAKEALAEANARLLQAMVLREAQGLHMSERGAQAAMKLCDFGPCLAGGAPDGQLVRVALAAFSRDWPEFQLSAQPAPFAAGTGSGTVLQDALKSALGVV